MVSRTAVKLWILYEFGTAELVFEMFHTMILENGPLKIAFPFAGLLFLVWLIQPEFRRPKEETSEILSVCLSLVYENLKLLLCNVGLSISKKIGDMPSSICRQAF